MKAIVDLDDGTIKIIGVYGYDLIELKVITIIKDGKSETQTYKRTLEDEEEL